MPRADTAHASGNLRSVTVASLHHVVRHHHARAHVPMSERRDRLPSTYW